MKLLALLILVTSIACGSQKSETNVVAKMEEKNIGVQIYSVRDALSEDFDGTLQKLSDIGFESIEAYGMDEKGMIYGMTPTEYKNAVEKHGMKLISSHATYFSVKDAPTVIKAAQEAGLEYVIVPYLSDEARKDYDQVAATLNEVGALFKEAGIGFGYHNHAFEFESQEDGRIPMEILIEGTDPENVDFEADIYWVVKAGFDPMELIKKYPGRFAAFHVKDADEALDQTTVGSGIIDFKTILGNKELAGLAYYFIEDERTDDPFGNLRNAHDYIESLDF